MSKKWFSKKKFVRFIKSSDEKVYGVDINGTHWNLEKLVKKGIGIEKVK